MGIKASRSVDKELTHQCVGPANLLRILDFLIWDSKWKFVKTVVAKGGDKCHQ